MYAIVTISGKQYKASEGTRARLPKQNGESGGKLTFENVLLINDGKNTQIGDPTLPGVCVTATILHHGRNKKILIYKKKRRKGYQRKNGHRQWYTEVEFQSIKVSGKSTEGEKLNKQPKAVNNSDQEEE